VSDLEQRFRCDRRDVDRTETFLLAAGLALFTVGVFVYVLKQPLPPWWGR